MKIYIKNMVCSRCKLVVKSELEKLGLNVLSVELGEAEIIDSLDDSQKELVVKQLEEFGFEVIDDKKSRLIEQVKTVIIELVHHSQESIKTNLSDFISEKLSLDYNYVSNLFSEVEGVTVEKYYILQRVEKVKELLVYDELNLSEIAYQLNYSSVAYLSNQFKKVTGFTPTYFKQLKEKKRKQIEDL
ncbi:AraC family transcriptional regulator [Flavobacterium amniphilum]|uniref:helix-turn-helix domain-containing protein n=1 Tax=Flavobacterium amniphilum TaxID=1834035 RepID=UPI002029FC26|nr:AraC family transcriptional regulator [Flavobacterium amniphilum]MCL9804567.1 AraC family transcriptional regulator [Flavobacterium amniphilum]